MNSARFARGLVAAGALAPSLAALALASSHSDASLIKQDPQANLTDVYAFVSGRYDGGSQRMLTVVVNVRPFSEPGDGVMYERFADDALYSIHITNPVTGETALRYDFSFSAVDDNYKNPGTIIQYGLGTEVGGIQTIGDARQNFTQTYSISRTDGGATSIIGADLPVPPPNAGPRATPLYNDAQTGRPISGATSYADLDAYTQQAISPLAGGEVAFAGPRDDSFFADTPAIFDLLAVRFLDNNGTLADGLGQDDGGTDGFKGFNVLTFAIQIPIEQLSPAVYVSPFFGPRTGVGVYASVSRRAIRYITAEGDRVGFGPWVQVNRLANPLFNEVLVATRDKDRYNRSEPTGDADFSLYALNPEIATLVNFVYQTQFIATGRNDLVGIYIPDVIRVDTTTPPVPQPGQPGFHRLGFIGGDLTAGISSGWPNGRRFGDDVVDIALTAVASGPGYSSITLVGDNIEHNDLAYNTVFPYASTPHNGPTNKKDRVTGDLDNDGFVGLSDLAIMLAFFGTGV